MFEPRHFVAAAAGLVAAAGAIAAGTAPSAPSPLGCRLALPARVKAGAPVPLRFELANQGARALRVLKWNTPLEGWFGTSVAVDGASGEVPYTGPQVKRAAPERGDYVTIGPGKSVTAVVDLAQVFALAPGEYRVAFSGRLHDVTDRVPGPVRTPATVVCPVAAVRIE